jgi:hypothetical protein
MSDSPEERAMATVKKAQQMIAEVSRQLEEGEEFLRKQGLDPAKVRSYCEQSLSPEDRRKAEDLIKQDMAAIEEEVQQAKLHLDDGSAPSKAKRPRSMV